MAVLDRILRAGEGRILRRLTDISHQVNAIEDDFIAMSDADLRAEADKLKERYADGETLDELMATHNVPGLSLAVVRGRSAKPRSARSASVTSTCRSWAALRCTSATSRR